jgi:hypothetical protein
MGGRVVQEAGPATDAGTHVPMLAWWRGTSPRGKVCEDLIDSTDFLPTMLDAAGVSPARALAPNETPLDGRSFLPQLRGQRGNPRDWIYCWHDPRPGWDKDKFKLEEWARNKRFKLYRDAACSMCRPTRRAAASPAQRRPRSHRARRACSHPGWMKQRMSTLFPSPSQACPGQRNLLAGDNSATRLRLRPTARPRHQSLAGPDMAAQTRQALLNVQRILEHCGSSLAQVARCNLYLTDYNRLPEANAVYAQFFSTHKPAKTGIGISQLWAGALIEIEVVASME